VELTVIEIQRDRLREAQSSFPAIRIASRLDDVEDELNAVVIATPPHSHGPLALQALRAGLRTLVEKPLATSVAQAEALVEIADAQGLTLMAGHTYAYNAAVWKLKQIIDSGELGRILYIDTARLGLGRYQNDCNVIWDLAPHDISIILSAGRIPGDRLRVGAAQRRRRPCRYRLPATGLPSCVGTGLRSCELVGPEQGSSGHRCGRAEDGRLQRPLR
jgi:predicted dehydrogenase